MNKFILIFLSLLCTNTANSQSEIYFFPSEKNFTPLRASIFESRIGATKDLNADNLRLDIGASAEIMGMNLNGFKVSAGVDFFTFSNLRTEANFKFPVDAIDYLFGINFNYKNSNGDLTSRLRLSHISSHLQDGHIYERTDTIFTPFVYSREFTDLEVIYKKNITDKFKLRAMGRLEYLFSTIPKDFGKVTPAAGLELIYLLDKYFSFYISDEAVYRSVSGNSNLNNNLEIGFKIGSYETRGFVLYFNMYDGQDYKGQYYDRMISYKSLGFKIDF